MTAAGSLVLAPVESLIAPALRLEVRNFRQVGFLQE
jgi:hypothetical protein